MLPAFGRLTQEDNKFEANLVYSKTLSVKTTNKERSQLNKQTNVKNKAHSFLVVTRTTCSFICLFYKYVERVGSTNFDSNGENRQ